MKNASSILSHISYQPQFKSIQKHKCYRKFLRSLPPKFQKAIAFVYIEKRTLFVALSHPGYKMELNYNKDLLKSLLSMLIAHDKECSMLEVSNIVVFNSKYHTDEKSKPTQTDPKYSELSDASFTIETDDEDIRAKFEDIKSIIIRNRGYHQ